MQPSCTDGILALVEARMRDVRRYQGQDPRVRLAKAIKNAVAAVNELSAVVALSSPSDAKRLDRVSGEIAAMSQS